MPTQLLSAWRSYSSNSCSVSAVTMTTIGGRMRVTITPNDRGNPPGKLADAELHFYDGPLEGLKLIGFSIWEARGGGRRNVTFPSRQYAVNGERRSFALLRPIADLAAQDRIRQVILDAFADYEHRPDVPDAT